MRSGSRFLPEGTTAGVVTRDDWTLASVCHSSDSSAGSSRSLEGTQAGVNAARAAGSPARGSTSPATSYPSAAKCRRAVSDMNSDRGIPVATTNAWMTGNQMPLTLTACLRIASGCDVSQPLLHVLADQLVTVAVQDEPDRRAALSLHTQKLRQPENAEDRFAQLGPALAAEQARLSAACRRRRANDR